jgi:2-iminobutanoate/2-iminopropanoate deaminase
MLIFRNHPELPEPAFPGSHLVMDDRYAYLSGLVAADLPGAEAVIGDVRAETELVMRQVGRLLALAEADIEDLVRVDVHLVNLSEIEAMDAVYAGFFPGGRFPARTCTESRRLYGGCRVEITCVARRPGRD